MRYVYLWNNICETNIKFKYWIICIIYNYIYYINIKLYWYLNLLEDISVYVEDFYIYVHEVYVSKNNKKK